MKRKRAWMAIFAAVVMGLMSGLALADAPQAVSVPPNLSLHGTDTIDCTRGENQAATLFANENLTLACSIGASPLNPIRFKLRVCEDAAGGHSLSWNNTNIIWSSGAPVLMPMGATNCLNAEFQYDGTYFVDMLLTGIAGAPQGGNGDTVGRIATTRNYLTTTSTGSTTQYKLIAATRNQFPQSTTFNTALTSTLYSYGVAQSSVGAGAAFQSIAYGPTNCVFDGQNTPGDAVIISSTVAGDCHDNGSAAVPAAGTQLVGYVLTANSGTGTSSLIYATLGSPQQSGFSTTATKVTNGTSNVSCGKGAASATLVGSATIGPFPTDPGTGNTYFYVKTAAAYAIFGATPPTSADIRFAVTCGGSQTNDDHGIPSTQLVATGSGPMTLIPALGAVGFGAKDINPNGCTAAIYCYEGASDATGAFQVYGASADGNGINQTSSWLVEATQNDQP